VLAGSGVTRESLLASAAQREVREVRGQSGERERERKRERERERERKRERKQERESARAREREIERVGGVTRPGVLTDAQPMYVCIVRARSGVRVPPARPPASTLTTLSFLRSRVHIAHRPPPREAGASMGLRPRLRISSCARATISTTLRVPCTRGQHPRSPGTLCRMYSLTRMCSVTRTCSHELGTLTSKCSLTRVFSRGLGLSRVVAGLLHVFS